MFKFQIIIITFFRATFFNLNSLKRTNTASLDLYIVHQGKMNIAICNSIFTDVKSSMYWNDIAYTLMHICAN